MSLKDIPTLELMQELINRNELGMITGEVVSQDAPDSELVSWFSAIGQCIADNKGVSFNGEGKFRLFFLIPEDNNFSIIEGPDAKTVIQ